MDTPKHPRVARLPSAFIPPCFEVSVSCVFQGAFDILEQLGYWGQVLLFSFANVCNFFSSTAFNGAEFAKQASTHLNFCFPTPPDSSNHTTHTPGVCVKRFSSRLDTFPLGSCMFPMGLSWVSNMEFLTECSVTEMERIPASTLRGTAAGKEINNPITSRLQHCARLVEYRLTVLSVCRHRISKIKQQTNKQNFHHQQRDTYD